MSLCRLRNGGFHLQHSQKLCQFLTRVMLTNIAPSLVFFACRFSSYPKLTDRLEKDKTVRTLGIIERQSSQLSS